MNKMKTYIPFFYIILFISPAVTCLAQTQVSDNKAQEQSLSNMIVNTIKAEQHKNVLDNFQGSTFSYNNLFTLQENVRQDLGQTVSIADLKWSDLSKSLYLATELIKGIRQPGMEFDFMIEHPVFQQSPDEIYQDLFVVDSENVLSENLQELNEAIQTSQSTTQSFHQLSCQRKAYAAVAFQYLSRDLLEKSLELNEALKTEQRFTMSETERMQLQKYCEDYLLLAQEMLLASDELLLSVGYDKILLKQARNVQKKLAYLTLSQTKLFSP